MANKLFKSFFAVAMLLGSALGFVACENEGDDVVADPTVDVSATALNFTMEEGSQTIELTANSDWKTEVEADWVTVTPATGKGDATITVAVSANDTGAVRTATVKIFALHKDYGEWDTEKITVSQSATEAPTVTEELVYGDNFDGKEATKTFGSGSSWPYIDQFPEFANAEGPGAENVTYSGKGVSVRANSTSNSQYSDYDGSGSNNIFFGSSAYFQANNITLDTTKQSYKLTFGSEKYTQDGDSTFKNEEFHVYLSKNGNGWAELDYTYAGTEGGRWNVATAEFTLTTVPETLYIKFSADVASVYRLDDVKLFVGNGGQSIDLPEEGGGNGGGSDEPVVADGPYASDAAFVCTTDDSANAAYGHGDTKIGNYAVTGFKLGKSKQAGKFTSGAVGVSGNKYLNFYAVAWKGGDATLYWRVNGGATQSQKLVANNGATGNTPYTALAFAASDHYSVQLTGLNESDTIEFSTDANFELTSSDSTMSSARAIVCGVKLSDEPIEGVGNETPAPTPGGTMTIAEAIAAADSTTLTLEGVTVIGVYSRGVLVEDTTGKLLVYAGSAVDAVVGDVVKVEGTMATYGGLRQVGGTVVVTKTGTTTYTYPTAETMDGAAFDAYLSNPVVKYVKYTGTLAISGYYYNVTVDGASTAVGSLAYVIEGTVDTALDGQQIDVYGWTIGFSGGKYVNTMISSVVAAGTTPTPDPEPEPTPGEVVKATVAEFLAAAEDDTIYELTGEITSVTNTTYGNFYLKDETGEVLIYGLCSPEGAQQYWVESGAEVGDTITVQTVRSSYNGTPQGKNAIFVSLVPGEGGSEEPEPTPGEVVKATVAEFLAAAEDDTIYELTGVIANVANTNYGNFDLKDETGTVYVYGLYDADGNKVFTSLGLKEGDTLTMRGVRTSYNDEPQVGSGVYVSHVVGETPEQPDNSATLSFADVANRTVFTEDQQVWEQNGVKLTNDKGSSTSNVADYSAPARFYKSSNITVEGAKSMTKIEFACNSASYATALQNSITSGTVAVDGSIVTVTLDSAAASYAINTLSAQVRMNSLTVYYAE